MCKTHFLIIQKPILFRNVQYKHYLKGSFLAYDMLDELPAGWPKSSSSVLN